MAQQTDFWTFSTCCGWEVPDVEDVLLAASMAYFRTADRAKAAALAELRDVFEDVDHSEPEPNPEWTATSGGAFHATFYEHAIRVYPIFLEE